MGILNGKGANKTKMRGPLGFFFKKKQKKTSGYSRLGEGEWTKGSLVLSCRWAWLGEKECNFFQQKVLEKKMMMRHRRIENR